MTEPRKRCTKCGEQKPLEAFNKRASSSDGVASRCRACCIAYARASRAAATDEQMAAAREYKRQYRADNPEATRMEHRRHYERVLAAKGVERQRAYQQVTPAHLRTPEMDATRRERIRIVNRAWKARNRGKVRAASRRSYANNIDVQRARRRTRMKQDTAAASTCYVRNLIALGLPKGTEIPLEIIELKRTHLQLNRLFKEITT